MAKAATVAREGMAAGAVGAVTVAAWFFVVDLIAGRPLFTPRILGEGLASVVGGPAFGATTDILVYTLFHVAVFIGVGMLLSWIVHRAETEPHVLVIFMLLFIIFEFGFYGLTAMLAESQLRSLAWYQIAAGNVLAAVSMGWYLWRAHPALKAEMVKAMEEG
jgi:hypothetical protein